MAEPTEKFSATLYGALEAPILWFDGVAAAGIGPSTGRVTLEAYIEDLGEDGRTINRRRVVAHLRGSTAAFDALRRSLDAMQAMTAPATDPSQVN